MAVTDRELWAVAAGLVLGSMFLLAATGILAAISTLRRQRLDRTLPHDGFVRSAAIHAGLRLTSSDVHPMPAPFARKDPHIRSRSVDP